MQRLSLRSQIMLPMVGLALLTSALIGWIGYQTAYDTLKASALHSVGLAAEARHQSLLRLLQNRKDRALAALEMAKQCQSVARAACLQRTLTQFLRVNRASSLRFASPHGALNLINADIQPAALIAPIEDLPSPPELARAIATPDHSGVRYFLVHIEPVAGTTLTVRYPMDEVDTLFADRYGLGESGESFLMDAAGTFLTPSRFAAASGSSEPLARCQAQAEGEWGGRDYRNVPVLQGFRLMPELGGACIMAQITQAEAFAPAERLRHTILLAASVLIGMALLLSAILSTAVSRPISRLLTRLEEALRARDEFLSICSHELKTPLTALRLRTDLAKRKLSQDLSGPLAETEIKSLVEIFDRQINRLNSLVDDTLDVSRINNGKFALNLAPVDLAELVRETAERMASQLALAGCKVEVMAVGSPLRGHWDRDRLEQVLVNLLSNAMRYGKGKPVQIEVRAEGNHARLSVKDHGIGIAPENHERIFERYERIKASAHAGGLGLGLGLYIVRHIVQAHGGAVRVESRVNAGSNFVVLLPLETRLT